MLDHQEHPIYKVAQKNKTKKTKQKKKQFYLTRRKWSYFKYECHQNNSACLAIYVRVLALNWYPICDNECNKVLHIWMALSHIGKGAHSVHIPTCLADITLDVSMWTVFLQKCICIGLICRIKFYLPSTCYATLWSLQTCLDKL